MSRDFFGHPRGLTTLAATEMWERFTYYGMRALLIYYLTMEVLLPGHVDQVLFYPQIKAFYESMSGPLNVQQLSSLIYGTYTGLVYATPLLGGWIADYHLGQRKTVIIGILLMGTGQFMMTSHALLFPSLLLMIFGTGFFKTNTTTQVGMLYASGDSRRDRAYSVFYVGTNLGAFLSPLIAGTLGEIYGWRYGFAIAGLGMVAALVNYLYGWRGLPAEHRVEAHKQERKPLTRAEWKSVAALILLVAPVTLWWACYEQQGNTMALWAMDNTDRTLIPGLVNWQMPDLVSVLQSLDDFHLHALVDRVLDDTGQEESRAQFHDQDGLWQYSANHFLSGSGLCRLVQRGRESELALVGSLFRAGHLGRALSIAHFPVALFQGRPAQDRLADDGGQFPA